MEEEFNDMDDFEEFKHFYYDLVVEFRQFVMKYNINHDLMKEKTINTFLEQQFLHLLKQKPDETPTINNEQINNKKHPTTIQQPLNNNLTMISNILTEPQ